MSTVRDAARKVDRDTITTELWQARTHTLVLKLFTFKLLIINTHNEYKILNTVITLSLKINKTEIKNIKIIK